MGPARARQTRPVTRSANPSLERWECTALSTEWELAGASCGVAGQLDREAKMDERFLNRIDTEAEAAMKAAKRLPYLGNDPLADDQSRLTSEIVDAVGRIQDAVADVRRKQAVASVDTEGA